MSDFNLWFLLLPVAGVVLSLLAARSRSEQQQRGLSLASGAVFVVFVGVLLVSMLA